MDQPDLQAIAAAVAATGQIGADHVAAVRRAVYGGDCTVSAVEAEALFDIERARRAPHREWSDLFVEALSDYALNQVAPAGYLSEDNSAWIEAQIKRRKEPSMDGDLALVAQLIEQAREVPPSFSAFALRLAKDAVLYGDGPDARGRMHAHGRVTDADVAMLQRILWGAGSEGLLAISREEAEALFAIADATTGADNVATFDDLFAKAIGNYLIGATGRAVPDRETALRWDDAGSYKADAVAMMRKMLSSAPDFAGALREPTLAQSIADEHAQRNMLRDVEIEIAAILTPDKASWLHERIARNGVTNGPEKALLAFIERESTKVAA
jgi:predicted anti-sigma-YlaC factor YlaD